MDVLLLVLAVLGALVGVSAGLTLLYLAVPLPFPLRTESDYSHHTTPFWEMYYGHKYLRPVRRPALGSRLKEQFAESRFDFDNAPLGDARRISLCATGDLMFRRDLVGEGSARLWDWVGPRLFGADLAVGNLEFAVNPRCVIEKTLRFSVPFEYALPLLGDPRFGKFDVMSLANNHINDSLSEGIVSTCDFLDEQGIPFVGAARTPQERDRVVTLERGGIRIAVLGYTFSTNNIPLEAGFEHGTNVVRFNALRDEDYDPSLIHRHISLARQQNADYIIACNHWGIDLEHYPPPRLVARARDLIDAGVDLIVGHHPHVIGPVECHTAPDGRRGIICYSLGNLTARGLIFSVQRLSQLAHVELEAGFDESGRRIVRPVSFALRPVYHSQDKLAGRVDNRLLPLSLLETDPATLTPSQRRILRGLRKRHREIVGSPLGLEIL